MAGTGLSSTTGLTLGGVVAAGAVLIGLWFGDVFTPADGIDPLPETASTAEETGAGTAESAASEMTTGAASGDQEAEDGASTETAQVASGSDMTDADAASDTDTAAVADTTEEEAETDTVATESTAAETGTDTAAAAPGASSPDTTASGMTDSAASDTMSSDGDAAAPDGTDTVDADAPRFDIVRVDAEGQTLVAGAARPGETVRVLIDGEVVGEETAGGDGKFVAFLDLPASTQSRVVTLETFGVSGEVSGVSQQDVILGPTGSSEATADAMADAGGATGTAPTVLLSDADGVRVLQSPSSAGSDVVGVQALSYGADGAVELSGQGLPGALVRLYLNGALVTEGTVAPDGTWSVDMSDADGDGTLRVDEVDQNGAVRSRIETAFSSTPPGADVALADAGGAGSSEAEATPATTQIAAADTAAPQGAEVPTAGVVTAEATEPAPTGLSESQTATQTAATGGADAAQPVGAATESPAATASTNGAVSITSVTVEKGSTLWAIAREKYGEGLMYVRVFEANKGLIRNPDLIYPGQVFNLPD